MSCIVITQHDYDAVIFDLDGTVTRTAKIHAAAWKELFDKYLKKRADREGEKFQPFDIETDYRRYVDGKPRYEGVKSFLEFRGIDLPYGDRGDAPGKETVCGLGNSKNRLFSEQLEKRGVETYGSTIDLIRRLRIKGIRTAVISSSKNCSAILKVAGIADLFDTKVDGVDSDRLGLKGKPAPDIFLEAAAQLGVDPVRAVVVEDAIAGVQAGRRGGFGCVVGVDRTTQGIDLKRNGADLVVKDLSEIIVGDEENRR
jgi:alpha,alpha-trehalase